MLQTHTRTRIPNSMSSKILIGMFLAIKRKLNVDCLQLCVCQRSTRKICHQSTDRCLFGCVRLDSVTRFNNQITIHTACMHVFVWKRINVSHCWVDCVYIAVYHNTFHIHKLSVLFLPRDMFDCSINIDDDDAEAETVSSLLCSLMYDICFSMFVCVPFWSMHSRIIVKTFSITNLTHKIHV